MRLGWFCAKWHRPRVVMVAPLICLGATSSNQQTGAVAGYSKIKKEEKNGHKQWQTLIEHNYSSNGASRPIGMGRKHECEHYID